MVFIFGCSEDKDEIPPTVVITSPSENENFQVRDNIIVKASIVDNERLEKIVVRFISEETRNVVLPSKTVFPQTKEYELDLLFELSDSLMKSGIYYFEVEAFDGENEFSSFRYVRVSGIPKKKVGMLVGCSGNGSTFIYEGDSDLNFKLIKNYDFRLLDATLNSDDQQLWLIPENDSEIEICKLNENGQSSSLTYMSGLSQTFTDVKRDEKDVFVALKQGELYGFTPLQQTNYSYVAPGDRLLDVFDVGKNNILLEETDAVGGNRQVNLLFRTSGAVQATFGFSNDIVDFSILNTKRAFIFYNNAQGGGIAELNLEKVSVRDLGFTTDSIHNVLPVNANELLIATSTKILYFRVSDLNLLDYLSIPNAVMEYDELGGILYVGNSNNLTAYNYSTKNLVASRSFTNPIKSIVTRYNRN